MSRKLGLAALAATAMLTLAGCNTGNSDSSGSSDSETPTTYSPAVVSGAVQIQADVCELVGQGYTTGQIIDSLQSQGYTNPNFASIVVEAAGNCP